MRTPESVRLRTERPAVALAVARRGGDVVRGGQAPEPSGSKHPTRHDAATGKSGDELSHVLPLSWAGIATRRLIIEPLAIRKQNLRQPDAPLPM